MWRLILCLAIFSATSAQARKPRKARRARSPNKVECVDPNTDKKFKLKIPKLKRRIAKVQQRLKKAHLHMLDLSDDAQDRRRRLPEDIATNNWCVVNSHMTHIEDAILDEEINRRFVDDKFSRVESWVRAGEWSPTLRTQVERQIAFAAAKISEAQPAEANTLLNEAIGLLFGLPDPWDLPASLPEPNPDEGLRQRVTVLEIDVEEGCPELYERGRGTQEDLDRIRRELRLLMNSRTIRVTDVKGGEDLLENLRSYMKLRAVWPSIRVACAVLNQVKTIEIDLGVTMGRFSRVNKLSNTVPEEKKTRFKELVRAASSAVSERDFQGAHGHLEELLVMLGAPKSPGDAVP